MIKSLISNNLNKKTTKYIFIAILVLIIFGLKTQKDSLTIGDEQRYIDYAHNLWHGYYSPPFPDVFIWNGPGYPIFLMPFVKIGFGVIGLRIVNAILYIVALILFDRLLQKRVSETMCNIVLFYLVFYIPIYSEMSLVLTESLTFLLITLFIVEISKEHINYFKSGFIFGFLVLTKVIFSYLLLAFLIFYMIRWALNRSDSNKIFAKVFLVAFILNLPYLFYTYSLTKKPLYWANSGGVSLYWMTSPHEGEFGDWPSFGFAEKLMYDTKKSDSLHLPEIQKISQLPRYLRDEAYKDIAICNIKNHPFKYFRNYVSNFQRLFFYLPNSYGKHREIMLWYLPFNIWPCLGLFFVIFIFFRYHSKISQVQKLLSMLVISYVGITCLVFAYTRFIEPVIPIILLLGIEFMVLTIPNYLKLLNKSSN